MKYKLFYLKYLLCTIMSAGAQSNVVPNGSFETYTSCPNTNSEIASTGSWMQPSLGDSDYYNTCAPWNFPNNSVSVPKNSHGYQTPVTGNAYAGFICYGGANYAWKEYIQTQLTNTLVAGQTYFISWFVSLANSSRFATDEIQAYFSNSPVTSTSSAYLNVIPQFSSPANVFITDTLNWTQVSGSFVASGGEQYITIGVFRDTVTTSRMRVNTDGATIAYSYYFIDDVCVSTSSLTCKIPLNTLVKTEALEGVTIFYDYTSKEVVFENLPRPAQITITDFSGRRFMETTLMEFDKINLSSFSPGGYIIYVSVDNRRSQRKIFVD